MSTDEWQIRIWMQIFGPAPTDIVFSPCDSFEHARDAVDLYGHSFNIKVPRGNAACNAAHDALRPLPATCCNIHVAAVRVAQGATRRATSKCGTPPACARTRTPSPVSPIALLSHACARSRTYVQVYTNVVDEAAGTGAVVPKLIVDGTVAMVIPTPRHARVRTITRTHLLARRMGRGRGGGGLSLARALSSMVPSRQDGVVAIDSTGPAECDGHGR